MKVKLSFLTYCGDEISEIVDVDDDTSPGELECMADAFWHKHNEQDCWYEIIDKILEE